MIENFLKAILPFQRDWRSIDLRVIAYRFQDVWFFNAVKAVLDPSPASKDTRKDLPEMNELLVIHERWDISQLDELLASISKGELIVGGNVVHIKRFDGQSLKPIPHPSFRFYERSECKSELGIDLASFVLQVYESSHTIHEEEVIIDHQLRTAAIPWNGLADLRQHFIRFRQDRASRRDSFLDIIAPLSVRMIEADIEEEKVRTVIDRKTKTNYDGISLSVLAHHSDGFIERVSCPIQKDETVLILKSPPTRATVIVGYRGIVVDQIDLLGQTKNLRIPVFQELLGNIQDFASELKENGRRLEAKVCLLFHLLGFSPAHYGYGTDDVPDILAFPKSDEKVLVIECTKREPDLGNKLTKLSTRSKEISRALGSLSVLPVVLTALERSMINTTDEDKARNEGIAILTQDEISTLIQMALDDVSPMEVVNYLSGLVPSARTGY